MSVLAVSISSSTMIARSALHVADDIQQLGLAQIGRACSGSGSPLLDDCQRRLQDLREEPGALGKSKIGDHNQVLQVEALEVVRQHVDGRELIDGDREEALDLALVEVHGEQSVGTGDADHVRHEAGGDRDAWLVLLVRSAVRVVRDDRRDSPGAGALEGVDHDQQLHDRLLDRPACRLDDEDIPIASVVLDANEDVLVRKLENLGATKVTAEVAGNLARQLWVGVARIQVELVAVSRRGTAAESGHEAPLGSASRPLAAFAERTSLCGIRTVPTSP